MQLALQTVGCGAEGDGGADAAARAGAAGGGRASVKDLTGILGQSQPRISRHLKLLAEAGLVERAPEGSWVYFRLAEGGAGGDAGAAGARGASIGATRCWCATGGGPRPCGRSGRRRRRPISRRMPASGTASARCTWRKPRWRRPSPRRWGRGRSICWSTSAPARAACSSCLRERYRRGIGIDLSPAMLAYARAKLERAGLRHAQVRQGDIYDLPLADQTCGRGRHAPGAALPERPAARHARGRARAGAGRAPADRRFRARTSWNSCASSTRTSGSDSAGPQVEQWLADCGLRSSSAAS